MDDFDVFGDMYGDYPQSSWSGGGGSGGGFNPGPSPESLPANDHAAASNAPSTERAPTGNPFLDALKMYAAAKWSQTSSTAFRTPPAQAAAAGQQSTNGFSSMGAGAGKAVMGGLQLAGL